MINKDDDATSAYQDDLNVNINAFDYLPGEEVELLIGDKTDLGFKALINNQHDGLLFHNEIFDVIKTGDIKRGYIKQIREDGKIDLSLQQQGYKHIVANRFTILSKLRANKGVLPYGDKTPPEVIYQNFNLSKKAFKKIIGALFKERLIVVNDHEIILVDTLGE